jgi:hypothetical protein
MTYYDCQITHSEVISWVSQKSRDPDTPDWLESWLSVWIHRIPVELLHLTDLELKRLSNPNRFRQSFRARAIPRTPDKQGSPPALRTFPLSLLYKEWTWEHYRKLNLTFSTLSTERSMGVFIRGLSLCFGWKWGSGGGGGTFPTSRPARMARQPSFMTAPTLGIGYPVHRPYLTRWQSKIWKGTNTWSAGPTLARVGLGLYDTSSPCVIFSVTMPYFGHI